jgi:hypothetical protein
VRTRRRDFTRHLQENLQFLHPQQHSITGKTGENIFPGSTPERTTHRIERGDAAYFFR